MIKVSLILILAFNCNAISQDAKSKIDEYIRRYVEMECFSGSVLVAKNDSVIFNHAYGMANYELKVPNTQQTVYRIASLTKPFTATLILQLIEKNKIRLEGKISDYLSDFNPKTGCEITIHHLLNHTSGLPQYEAVHDFIERISRLPLTRKEMIKLISGFNLLFESGTNFKYSSFGYIILGEIIEKVANTSYEKLLREHIIQPAGMKNTFVDDQRDIVRNRANGYDYDHDGLLNAHFRDMSTALGTGNIISTTEDLFLFIKALLNGKLLNKTSLELMFEKHDSGSGYGWFISTTENNLEKRKVNYFYHTGGINGFHSIMSHYEDGTTIIILSNFSFIQREKLERDIYAIVNGGNYILPKIIKSIKLDSKVFSNYIGKYEFDSLHHVKISGNKNGLYCEYPDSTWYTLLPSSNNNFYVKEKDIEIIFHETKNPEGMILQYFENGSIKFVATKTRSAKTTIYDEHK